MLTFGTSLQAMPFHPLPPPVAMGLEEQASAPTKATLAVLAKGRTPPSFL